MKLSDRITRLVDFFYIKPIRQFIPKETFRYAFCGGVNLVLGWIIYSLLFHYVVGGLWIDLGFTVMAPRTVAYLIQFPVTFLTGFWLNRNVTFTLSPLRSKTQFFRYMLQVAGSFLIDYLSLKLFTDVFGIYPTAAKPLASLVTVIYSYFTAKFFTFRGNKE